MGDMMSMMMWGWANGGDWGGKSDWKKDGGYGAGSNQKPGDWVCPECGNVNFSNREKCNKCGASGRGQKRLGMKPGDWICPNCGGLVFASTSLCKMCGNPKPAEL